MINQHFGSFAHAAVVVLFSSSLLQAQVSSQSGKLVVLKPDDLPEIARLPSDSFFLRSTSKGDFYLYLEQKKGSQLTILDVSDPAKIKVKSTEQLAASGSYDFIRPLGDNAELLRFRDGKSPAAVLNFHKEGAPELQNAAAIKDTSQTVVLDETNGSANEEPYKYVRAVPHDYEVVDSSSKDKPEVVTTVKQVEHEITNKSTGTTFLLGASGLTVIRRTDLEDTYKAHLHQIESQ
jgi:hypothetical protein